MVIAYSKAFVPLDVDDIATADDLEAHRVAMEEFSKGETIAHDKINWD